MTIETDPPETITALLRRRCLDDPDAPAVWDGQASTVAALDAAVGDVATALVGLGVASGSRVAIWAPNSEPWALMALGALRIGAVVVPLNTRFTGAEATALLERARCDVLAVDTGFRGVDLLEELRSAGGRRHARLVVVLGGPVPDDAMGWQEMVAGAAEADAELAGAYERSVTGDMVSHLQFTSGTTGRPKGALLTNRAMVVTTRAWCEVAGLVPGDRYLITSPLFHLGGHKTGVLASIVAGAAFSFEPLVDTERLMARISQEKVTVLQGPPTLYSDILDHPARPLHDLGSLRLAVTGAAMIPEQLIARMQDELSFEDVLTAYGTTETTGVVTMCRRSDPPEVVAATSGRAVPGVELRIDSAPGETEGEILVRGDGRFAGYLDDPEATAAVLDGEGWYHTGDVGRLDHGNLVITDRLADLILVGGFNVYPAEVEATLRLHPAVADVAVVGAPDDRLGEIPVAFVVTAPATPAEPDELLDWARTNIASHKRPRLIRVVDELPRNPAGKILKTELRKSLER